MRRVPRLSMAEAVDATAEAVVEIAAETVADAAVVVADADVIKLRSFQASAIFCDRGQRCVFAHSIGSASGSRGQIELQWHETGRASLDRTAEGGCPHARTSQGPSTA